MTSESGRSVIINDWKASGIFDAIKIGSAALPPIGPFTEEDSLDNAVILQESLPAVSNIEKRRKKFVQCPDDEGNSNDGEWGPSDQKGNAS